MAGLIGKKLGMTQIYSDGGELFPVTVVAAGPCPVVNVRTEETNGYAAVQLGYGEVKPRKVTKPVAGQYARGGISTHRILREIRTGGEAEFEVGQVLDVSQFEIGDSQIKYILTEGLVDFDYEIVPLLQKDSLDMTDDHQDFGRGRVCCGNTLRCVDMHLIGLGMPRGLEAHFVVQPVEVDH